jgi:hypothetical protein
MWKERFMGDVLFQSVIEGNVIVIPPEYRDRLPASTPVSVIIKVESGSIVQTRTKKKPFASSDFHAVTINTKDWKFNRDEANER